MQQVLGGLPHCRQQVVYGAGCQTAAPEPSTTPKPVGQGLAATGWSLCMYLRGLKWLEVNARGIRVVTTRRRSLVVLPVLLSAICDVLIVSFRLWGRIAVDLVLVAILSRPPKIGRRVTGWRESASRV